MRKACATVATLGVLTLAACNGEEPPPDTEPSSTITAEPTTEATEPSSTESSSEPTEPTPPAVLKGKPSKKAAEAFVEFYWQLVDYAEATGDTKTLESVEGEFCDSCRGGRQWIEDVYTAGGRIVGGTHQVDDLRAQQAPSGPDAWVVFMQMKASTAEVTGAGDLNKRYPSDSYPVTFVVSTKDDAWLVDSWDPQ